MQRFFLESEPSLRNERVFAAVFDPPENTIQRLPCKDLRAISGQPTSFVCPGQLLDNTRSAQLPDRWS
jgi:hypothetical protein